MPIYAFMFIGLLLASTSITHCSSQNSTKKYTVTLEKLNLAEKELTLSIDAANYFLSEGDLSNNINALNLRKEKLTSALQKYAQNMKLCLNLSSPAEAITIIMVKKVLQDSKATLRITHNPNTENLLEEKNALVAGGFASLKKIDKQLEEIQARNALWHHPYAIKEESNSTNSSKYRKLKLLFRFIQ